MATDQENPGVHPGDIIQDSDGQIMMVTQVRPRFIGAVQRWHDGIEMVERYHRLKPNEIFPCGAAKLMPEAIAQARRDSLKLAAQIAKEAGQ